MITYKKTTVISELENTSGKTEVISKHENTPETKLSLAIDDLINRFAYQPENSVRTTCVKTGTFNPFKLARQIYHVWKLADKDVEDKVRGFVNVEGLRPNHLEVEQFHYETRGKTLEEVYTSLTRAIKTEIFPRERFEKLVGRCRTLSALHGYAIHGVCYETAGDVEDKVRAVVKASKLPRTNNTPRSDELQHDPGDVLEDVKAFRDRSEPEDEAIIYNDMCVKRETSKGSEASKDKEEFGNWSTLTDDGRVFWGRPMRSESNAICSLSIALSKVEADIHQRSCKEKSEYNG